MALILPIVNKTNADIRLRILTIAQLFKLADKVTQIFSIMQILKYEMWKMEAVCCLQAPTA